MGQRNSTKSTPLLDRFDNSLNVSWIGRSRVDHPSELSPNNPTVRAAQSQRTRVISADANRVVDSQVSLPIFGHPPSLGSLQEVLAISDSPNAGLPKPKTK
jgi:hypothetical protein